MWYSGEHSRHQHGVGFIVNKNKLNSVISCARISSRLISIRIAAWPLNRHPSVCLNDGLMMQLKCFMSSNTINETPKKDFLEMGTDAYVPISVRRFGLVETNNRGLRLLDFARNHKLTLANTSATLMILTCWKTVKPNSKTLPPDWR